MKAKKPKEKSDIKEVESKKEFIKGWKFFSDQFNTKSKEFFERVERALRVLKADHLSTFKYQNQQILKQTEYLAEIKKTCECVEDTLLNVLLAIRQNEYLQAYYPAQNGYNEMKVTGTHPSKTRK